MTEDNTNNISDEGVRFLTELAQHLGGDLFDSIYVPREGVSLSDIVENPEAIPSTITADKLMEFAVFIGSKAIIKYRGDEKLDGIVAGVLDGSAKQNTKDDFTLLANALNGMKERPSKYFSTSFDIRKEISTEVRNAYDAAVKNMGATDGFLVMPHVELKLKQEVRENFLHYFRISPDIEAILKRSADIKRVLGEHDGYIRAKAKVLAGKGDEGGDGTEFRPGGSDIPIDYSYKEIKNKVVRKLLGNLGKKWDRMTILSAVRNDAVLSGKEGELSLSELIAAECKLNPEQKNGLVNALSLGQSFKAVEHDRSTFVRRAIDDFCNVFTLGQRKHKRDVMQWNYLVELAGKEGIKEEQLMFYGHKINETIRKDKRIHAALGVTGVGMYFSDWPVSLGTGFGIGVASTLAVVGLIGLLFTGKDCSGYSININYPGKGTSTADGAPDVQKKYEQLLSLYGDCKDCKGKSEALIGQLKDCKSDLLECQQSETVPSASAYSCKDLTEALKAKNRANPSKCELPGEKVYIEKKCSAAPACPDVPACPGPKMIYHGK